MKRLSVLLLMLASLPIMAQENIVDRLLQVVPDQGVITIHQDSRLEALLGVTYDPSKSKGKKIPPARWKQRQSDRRIPHTNLCWRQHTLC